MDTRFAESLHWLERQQPRMVDLLQAWAAINSGSYHLEGLAAQGRAILAVLQELGDLKSLKLHSLPPYTTITDAGTVCEEPLGMTISLHSLRRPGPHVLLAIHYDTVFGKEDAFQSVTRIDHNTLRGPGICDAKGGLVVMLFALMALERSPFASRLNWEIILNPDEELGSPGSAALFQDAAQRHDVGLLFEPALPDGALVSSRRGSGNFTFVVHGKSAHAGRNPDQGRNAISALATLVTKLAILQSELPGTTINTGFIHGGGPVNIVPDLAMCRVNVRVDSSPLQSTIEDMFQTLAERSQADGIRVKLHGGFSSPPKAITPDLTDLMAHIAACGAELGLRLSFRPTGGACDGNRLAAAGLPVIDPLGVRGGNIHTDQEFIQLDSLVERSKLTALFLMRLASGDVRLSSMKSRTPEVAP